MDKATRFGNIARRAGPLDRHPVDRALTGARAVARANRTAVLKAAGNWATFLRRCHHAARRGLPTLVVPESPFG